jgi:hypothetical protein
MGDLMVAKKKEPVKKIKVHKKEIKQENKEAKSEKKKPGINKVFVISSAIVLIILIVTGVFVYLNKDKLFDKVVASVNGEKIYLKDVNDRFALYQGAYTKEDLLNQTIIEKLLLQEAAKQNLAVTDEDFNKFLDSLLVANSMNKDQLMQELKTQGISYSEFEKSYKQRILIEKLINGIIKDISVAQQEIDDYYLTVKSQLPENVTFEDVKDLINQTLVAQKQNAAFTEVVTNMIANAKIITHLELIQEKAVGQDKVVSLAKCLTEKGAIMYGASWCSHCANQKAMFGDAFQYITYNECDTTGKEACDAAGIQGYPTWTIGGQNYEGEITLENLAKTSGCAY